MTLIIILKTSGALLIIFATYAATVKVTYTDKKISEVQDRILVFKDSRLLVGICKLDYGEHFTKRRLELFERNQLILHKGDERLVEELSVRALNDTIELARSWATLLSADKKDELLEITNEKINKIVNDKNIPLTEKIDEVEEIWKANQSLASDRLREAHTRWQSDQVALKKYETDRIFWNQLFLWTQITGLILLAIAEVAEIMVQVK